MSKIKGTKGERELLSEFWGLGWAAIRSAGSGSMRFPSPDLLVGKNNRKLAVECKVTKKETKYLPKEEVEELREFSRVFGAEPWLAIRFRKERWLFLNPEDLVETEKSFYITKEKAKNVGLGVEGVIK